MLYYTQLIYTIPGQEPTFHMFEEGVLPFLPKHNGKLLLRIRPSVETVIETNVEVPYEIHLVTFTTKNDFNTYLNDPERLKFIELKNKSIRKILLIEGNAL